MINAVNGGGSGWNGGLYQRSGLPTDVGGQGFGTPGTADGTPPGVPTASIKDARNNRGSNVRIPYARLVRMHGRADKHIGHMSDANTDSNHPRTDTNSVVVNGQLKLEYDGLRTGELGWILGRRFKQINTSGQEAEYEKQFVMGSGVDRMQRMASTDWIMAMFQNKLGGRTINLHQVRLGTPLMQSMDSNLKEYASYLAGATALRVPDVTKIIGDASSISDEIKGQIGEEKAQGVFCADMGPFLRGMQVSTNAFDIKSNDKIVHSAMPRNLGDVLAFSGIEAEFRLNNMMDWSPDGIVLSKLESPADDALTSMELDAQQAQLFNMAVQGPAITTTWTSDVRDSKLECQPLDKCFVCIVADLDYLTKDQLQDGQQSKWEDATARIDALAASIQADIASLQSNPNMDPVKKAEAMNSLESKIGEANEKAKSLAELVTDNTFGATTFEDTIKQALKELKTAEKAENASTTEGKEAIEVAKRNVAIAKRNLEIFSSFSIQYKLFSDNKYYNDKIRALRSSAERAKGEEKTRLNALIASEQEAYNKFNADNGGYPKKVFGNGKEDQDPMTLWKKKQLDVRTGKQEVVKATLSNFRLMRTTSSHMTNYSHFDPKNRHSRCGLPLSFNKGSYIIGGWCIGTVLDSAASRSTIGTLVRTNPTSMALNLNVNIEWWSGDRLYKHYMDADEDRINVRGQHYKRASDAPTFADKDVAKAKKAKAQPGKSS